MAMYQSMTSITLLLSLLSFTLKSQTLIDRYWSDNDQTFVYSGTDPSSGWATLNIETGNSIEAADFDITGANGRQYHGPWTQFYDATFKGRYTWLSRQFTCAKDSAVNVSFAVAYCQTNEYDWVRTFGLDST